MNDTRRQSRKGVNLVASFVEGPWCCGWEEFSSQNDDAVDGIIIMRRGSKPARDTGGIVFTQIKCGQSYLKEQKSYPDHICIDLGDDYIGRHMDRWQRLPGPVVLIYVSDTTEAKAWWVDLRSDCLSPTNKGIVLIPKEQRFAENSKGKFQKLCGSKPSDRMLPEIMLTNEELLPVKVSSHVPLKQVAWTYYKAWRKESSDYEHPLIGPILINRVGWKHMSRVGRNPHRIIYSWQLLCAAKKMIFLGLPLNYLGNAMVRRTEEVTTVYDFFGIRAHVSFPHRDSSVVQVVLQRARIFVPAYSQVKQKVWFYSVYEKRRGNNGNLP